MFGWRSRDDGAGLAPEALQEAGRLGQRRPEHFDSDVAVERGVVGLIHHRHAAAPEARSNDVRA